eukprot:CAMPEP_0181395432 /NCGR_PEP_ID=MMETSP1106-20121128/28336_1 /TAXON_ID=81844 /ORGANISM="Mantoniella antarctica, Strain SL-175" /LENGTH=74 /DNA_ID=CAMNT_0023517051 /DNA_START=93 /DNA_END=317 /DNA_ORIENTATION=+
MRLPLPAPPGADVRAGIEIPSAPTPALTPTRALAGSAFENRTPDLAPPPPSPCSRGKSTESSSSASATAAVAAP